MIFSFKNFENLMKKYHILSIMLAWKKVNHIWSIDGYSGIKLLFFLWNHQKSRFALLTKKSVRFQAFESLLPFTYQLLFLNLSKIWCRRKQHSAANGYLLYVHIFSSDPWYMRGRLGVDNAFKGELVMGLDVRECWWHSRLVHWQCPVSCHRIRWVFEQIHSQTRWPRWPTAWHSPHWQ